MARDTMTISPKVIEHLRGRGVEVPAIPEGELTTDAYFAFWRDIADRAGRPALGLEVGAAVFGRSPGSEAALHAATFGDAIRTIGRYKRLTCPEEVVLEVRDGEASVRCDWILADGEVPSALVDAVFSSYVRLFQHQLDDVRRVAARRLLVATELEPIDIAFLLGFVEPNSFTRAFRSWERTTPLRWRATRS